VTTTSSSSTASSSTASSSSTTSGTSGVVTHIAFAAGKAPRSLQPLLTVSGTTLYAFVSPSPLYKNLSTSLSSGTQVANVKALQRALAAGGYYSGQIDGDFDSSTAVALEGWQDAKGLSVTGTLDISKLIWVPKGAIISDWQVSLGSTVSGGTALASIDFPQLEAQALVGQADISSLKAGQKAQMTVDGHSDTIVGTIVSISEQPSSSSSTTGSSSTVQYTVTLKMKSVPSYARNGMTGSLEVTIKQRKNVLVVPTSAITGSSSTSFVRILMSGQPVVRQVETGMATASSTEITSGLAVGETVITGTVTASAGTNASSGGSILSGGGAGGSFPGGGAFPGGGTRRNSTGAGASSGAGQ
jgi:hypothetical protein